MKNPKTIIFATALAAVLLAAVAVKLLFFPPLQDAWFLPNRRSLQKAPSGLAAIRVTHFRLRQEDITYAPAGKGRRSSWRISGRNVSLRDMVAAAYGETRGRVVLPFDAPTNTFDFIVTTANPRRSLQRALRHTFGYTAEEETNETEVLALKVINPNPPAMTVSGPDEKPNSSFKKGKIYLTHLQLKELTPTFEQILKTPVVDETGLTNYYDLSLDWNGSMGTRLQKESTARPLLDKILTDWGLDLEPDTAAIEVLVVKKAY